MKTRIIHRLHRFFKERFLNLCDLRIQPAPDRVEHYDDGGKHDDRSKAGVDESLDGRVRFLRQRPENIGN